MPFVIVIDSDLAGKWKYRGIFEISGDPVLSIICAYGEGNGQIQLTRLWIDHHSWREGQCQFFRQWLQAMQRLRVDQPQKISAARNIGEKFRHFLFLQLDLRGRNNEYIGFRRDFPIDGKVEIPDLEALACQLCAKAAQVAAGCTIEFTFSMPGKRCHNFFSWPDQLQQDIGKRLLVNRCEAFKPAIEGDYHLPVCLYSRLLGLLGLLGGIDERDSYVGLRPLVKRQEFADDLANISRLRIISGCIHGNGQRSVQFLQHRQAGLAQAVACVLADIPLDTVFLRQVPQQQCKRYQRHHEQAAPCLPSSMAFFIGGDHCLPGSTADPLSMQAMYRQHQKDEHEKHEIGKIERIDNAAIETLIM